MTHSAASPSPTAQQQYLEKATRYFDRLGRLNLWSGIAGMKQIEAEQESHRKNREAEEQFVRKTAWGYDETESGPAESGGQTQTNNEADGMGHTILGDIQNPAPIVITQPSQPQQPTASAASWLLPAILGAAIPTGMGGAALATYMLNRPSQTPTEYVDESVSMGLGQIEDYLRDE